MKFAQTVHTLAYAYNDPIKLGDALINLYRIRFPRARLTGKRYDYATRMLVPWRVSREAVREWQKNGGSQGALRWMLAL